ncbi:type II toxin-antitoxin system RelB/DinJ family antitoxin [Muribacter muris]|uniref:Type II toxin-antitoxin system RelB/DinJ family antitoxin n=1 Tax=Muribacter muris TaxID=67855 RepID=A0A4Y9K1J1_9PAST|nr:type II toxin-antitoxin system RelB/DinJ family antitoxin [Muribacter muris]MBF0784661.1 type II toxin-antitoxin system RelB/DinJ family antitoxin [Muribacter muris]MBF0828138.1 type II toxin-antitoxin system RelB/DinJ family antitoxin [Muribacter muris]TFV11934.1 type II toxin-antitoxin system RelB/DinJ family antitoxin [Muribacter muris]
MATINNASFSFRLTESLKTEAFGIIEQYGFTPSQVFNLFLTEIAKTKTVPVNLDYLQPNEKTLRAMAEVESDEVEIIPVSADTDIVQLLSQYRDKE